MSDPNNLPPGWYDDGHGVQRWWDGGRWSEHTAPSATQTPAPVKVEPARGIAPGWYDDGSGRMRWWDGTGWTAQYAPQPAPVAPVQQAPGFMYVRPQQGHSIVLHLLFGWIVLYIPTIYYAASSRHYFHA